MELTIKVKNFINKIKYFHFYSILVDFTKLSANISLNTFIRQKVRLFGTKFMCLEGGCGCCIVNVQYNQRTFAVNSCLVLLATCHGWIITTIEGLGTKKYGYHAIQKKLASTNGSQCGYCSPGMVMNMYSLLKSHNGQVTMQEVEDSFDGNICRCTGYRPILDAMKSFAVDTDDIEDIEDLEICTFTMKCWSGESSFKTKDNGIWFMPKSVDEVFDALEMCNRKPYILVAGGTSHGVYRRDDDIKNYISLKNIEDLYEHKIDEKLVIGANLSITETIDIFDKVSHMEGFLYCKILVEHFKLIANLPIRNVSIF